jgi:homoserine dehydrogenase
LKGSDNIIAFTTKRYPNPLIVQGAGAGAAVTASGIFNDLLTIADRVL